MDGSAAPLRATRTTCPYCGVGCGVIATVAGAEVAVAGDPDHPASLGRLCSKGGALGETMGMDERLLTPRIGGAPATWPQATALIADRFARTIAEHGPDAVALYVSGQLLTEDYYIANKLMKGFIGSANIDTNSRLCMASSVAGHRRAFGTDTVPGAYEDFEQADLVVLVGSNLAWCHPVLFQRLLAARAARPQMRIVTIDPRRTATAEQSDLHLAIRADGDVALFNGLLAAIFDAGAHDPAYIAAHVTGMDAALATARASLAAATGLDPAALAAFWGMWIGAERVVTAYSQGVNQSASGTDKVNAILNCHLATGRIGRPGMGPFSVTGQPNAMGGREVGGLANMLACHLDIENPDHRAAVATFWGAPRVADRPGLKAVEMFQAVADGRIKAIWVIATNPVASLPDADAVRAGLAACPFVVVSEVTDRTDTAALAHVLLPALGWGEKDGTVTNSDRCISRQRAFLPAPGEARPDWRALSDVAAAMGWGAAFAQGGPAAIFAEYARLSGVAAGLGRDFDISAWGGIDAPGYDALAPAHWPQPLAAPPRRRFFAQGGFYTPDARARAVAVVAPAPVEGPLLNTGRIRDQWHMMTRTGLSPRLTGHIGEPFVEIHPDDAARLGLGPADLVVATGRGAAVIARAAITDAVAPGAPFAPMHWTDQHAARARVGALIPPLTDPVSGQPALKMGPVALARYPAAWQGFAVSRTRPDPGGVGYWAVARTRGGWRVELGGIEQPGAWEAYARRLTGGAEAQALVYADAAAGQTRVALMVAGRLHGALFVAPGPVAVARGWLAGQLGQAAATVLAGHPGTTAPDPGPTVCACLEVGLTTIRTAIHTHALTDVPGIGRATAAGTNCGSCRPALAAILAEARQPA